MGRDVFDVEGPISYGWSSGDGVHWTVIEKANPGVCAACGSIQGVDEIRVDLEDGRWGQAPLCDPCFDLFETWMSETPSEVPLGHLRVWLATGGLRAGRDAPGG